MNAILLSPHADDETLFAAYTILRHSPKVIVCLRPADEDEYVQRRDEFYDAMRAIGTKHEDSTFWARWHINANHYRYLEGMIGSLAESYDHCFAPATIDGGHAEHNMIGQFAISAFGPERTTGYHTYRRGSGRSRGTPVPYEPHWPGLKLRAMACYQSQVNLPATQPWFANDWLEEWTA